MVHISLLDTGKFIFHSCDIGCGFKEAFLYSDEAGRLFIPHASQHHVSTMALAEEEAMESPPSVCPDAAAFSSPWARTSPVAFPFARALGWRGRGIIIVCITVSATASLSLSVPQSLLPTTWK